MMKWHTNGVNKNQGSTQPQSNLPSGVDLTLSELQEMAARQQAQLESQQQSLVAKEQRLKFLKQQESRHQQMANENERLRKLREKVESQEMKLKKLRALKGEVNDFKSNNTSLTSELESIKALFNEKEKELSVAVVKVESLNRQLEELRQGSATEPGTNNTPAHAELDKLKQELMLRNKLNEQQNSKLVAHRGVLSQRKDDMAKMDRRISELQARLRRKRALAEQRNNMISNKSTAGTKAGRPLSANIAAVEPYIQRAPQELKEEALKPDGGYPINKADPKYQTLPHSLKFPAGGGEGRDAVDNNNKGETGKMGVHGNKVGTAPGQLPKTGPLSLSTGQSALLVGQPPATSAPQPSPTGRSSAGIMSNFAPKPYGSMGTFSTALTAPARTTVGETSPIYNTSGSHLGPKTSTPITPGGESRTNAMKEIFITGAPSQTAGQPRAFPSHGTGKSYLGNSTPAPYPGSGAGTTAPHPATSTAVSGGVGTNSGNNQRAGPPNYATSMAQRTQPPGYGARDNPPASSTSQGYYRPTTQPPPPPTTTVASSTGGNAWGSAAGGRTQTAPARGDAFLPRSAAQTYPGNRQATAATNNWHQVPPHGPDSINPPQGSGPAGLDNSRSGLVGSTQQGQRAVPPQSLPQSTGPADPSAEGDKDLDTSPTSVMSALDILKAGGPMGNAPKTYRYAPKSVIANTYMRKLGSSTLEKYRQNMSALYKDFVPGVSQGGDKTPGSPTATVRPLQQGAPAQEGAPQGYDRLSNGPAPYNADMERRHRPNAPRPLRRRLSQEGTSEDYHTRQGARLSPTQEGFSRPKSPTAAADDVFHAPQVVRVDHVQDSDSQESSTAFHHQASTLSSDSTSGISTESSALSSLLSERGRDNKKLPAPLRKTNLKKKDSMRNSRRVSFDPLALLLDASLEGELELVMRTAKEVTDPSAPNDEGITALHNAICAGHYGIVKFLIEFGCNVNAPDSDGWTPLHCAASCNNLPMVKFLVEHGACIFATTISDHETAAEKCEEDEDGFDGCSEYLYSIQEKLGILNQGKVYAVFDYTSMNSDELTFETNDELGVVRKGDENEMEWWWARKAGRSGYIPRNLMGLTPRVAPQWLKSPNSP